MNEELIRKYLKVEDEVEMRLSFKKILDMHGKAGLASAMGEMVACLQIAMDVLDGK